MCISVSGSDLRLVYLLQLIHRGTGKVLLECSLTGLQGYLIRPGEPNGVCWFIKFVDKCQFDINNLQPAGQAPPINAADTAYHCYLLSNNHTTFANHRCATHQWFCPTHWCVPGLNNVAWVAKSLT